MKLIAIIWLKILKEWWQLTVPMRLRSQGVELGTGVRFYGMPIVGMAKGSRIRIGDRTVLCSDSRFTALGVNHPVVLRTLRPDAEIIIGSDCGISGGSICAAIRVELGSECLLGSNVTITDTDFHAIKPEGRRYNNNSRDIGAAPVRIEENVFIGVGAVVLKGVSVGRNSVIGAMSVVSKDVRRNSICAGVPAIPIRNEIQSIL
jgi:acetyltransferase-like isoleucine patch superfamily enzyme